MSTYMFASDVPTFKVRGAIRTSLCNVGLRSVSEWPDRAPCVPLRILVYSTRHNKPFHVRFVSYVTCGLGNCRHHVLLQDLEERRCLVNMRFDLLKTSITERWAFPCFNLCFFCERPTYGVSSPRLFTSLIREAEELRRRKQNYNE